MDLFIFDSTLTKVQSVLTELELIEAVEERELGKAGQLTFTIANEYANSVKELNIVAVPVEGSKVRLYVVSNKAVEADTTTITAISYPNYFLSRVGYVKDLRPKERPLKELIPQILGDSGFTLNKVDSSLAPYTGSFYYMSRLEALSQISEAIACEFDLYATISKNALTGQYVDVVSMLGSDTGKRFEYGSNALEVVAEYDATEVYSQAIGRGKGEETGDGYGRRIEFTEVEWKKSNGDPVDKPKGQNWVDDPYGNYMLPTQKRALKILEFEEIEDPAYLLSQTYSWLVNNNRPKVQFKASVTEVDGLELGDRVQIVRSDLNLRYTTRVFSVKRNLLNESLNEISLGDNIATTPMDKLNSITNKIDAATDTIQRVEQQVAMVDANGVRVNYGKNEPSNKKPGDIWYKEQEDGSTILLQWNGEEWERVVDDKLIEEVVQAVDSAVNDAESAKNSAQQAVDKAGEIEKNFNTEIGSVKIDIEDMTEKLEQTVQDQDSLNKRIQTAEGTIDSIENMTGSNTLINTVNGMKQEVTDAKGNASQALQTAQGVQTSVYNTGNIWMTPDFQTTPLSKYTNTSDTDGNVRIVTNGVPNSATEEVKYNQPYKKRNNSNKSIRFEGRTDGNRDCFQKEEYNIQVAGGDRFDISFDFYKTPEGSAGAGFKLIAEDGSISWIALYAKQESLGAWWHIDGQIEVPSDKQYIKAQAFISYGKVSSSSGQYCYMDNISIKKVTGSNYAQYSTITQTIEGIQTQVQDNEGNISKVTQTAQGIVSSVNNIQSVLGPTYPNGSFIDKDFNKYYTVQNSVSGATATIPSGSDFLQLKTGVNAKASAMLTDYIEFDMNKPIEFRFKAYFNNTTYDKPRMYVHEYDADYKEVRNGNDSIFNSTDKAGAWYEVKKSWIVDKTNKPKYFRVEWVCWDNGSGNNELRIANASLSNGQANIGTNITQLQDDINLRVKKGDVITQINLDSSGVLIDGAKNHITGQTTIDNAVIKSSMIDTITANKITTGTLNAANVKIINLDVNSLTGNLTQFVQTQWNSVNSGVSIDGNGLKIKASNGENILLTNGTFQFRDSGNKEIIGISRFSDGAVNLAVRKGERFSISYDGTDSTDNAFASALSFHGTTGSITFNSQNIWFQDRELRFTTMDWGNGRIPSIRNTDNVAGIGLGSKALYFGDSVGVLTLDNIRNGKLNKITFPDGRALTLQSGTISGTKVGYLVGTNDVGIAWSGGDLYFNNNYTSGWIKFNDILKKLGFV